MGYSDTTSKTNTPSRVTAELVRDLAIAATNVKHESGYAPVLLVPDGYSADGLMPEYNVPLPDHIRQSVKIHELESFNAYVKQFATSTARIFATTNDKGACFNAVLNYHEGGKEGKPARATHRVAFEPEYSPEFAAWLKVNKQPMTQEQFLDHLRRWGSIVTSHTDADLIEIASSLDFTTAVEFTQHTERVKGGRKLHFNERVEGTGQLKGQTVTLPESLALKAAVFAGGREYDLSTDVLYRPQNGQLRIILELRRENVVIRQAVKDLVADVEAGTGIAPFIGALA